MYLKVMKIIFAYSL